MTHHARIVVDGLTKAFGSVRAVDGLSFAAEPGAITGFLGANGAGKTTTLRMLLGLVTPDAGQATIAGRAYTALDQPARFVGAALDSSGYHPARTGRNHLLVAGTVIGIPDQRVDEVLELVGLTDAADRQAGGYSLGMRQRLALATAMLGDPHVLVLDEPANGLDPQGIRWMRSFLRRLADEGRTLLVSSHVLSEMQLLVDDVVIIHRGRLVRQGRLAELSDADRTVTVRSPDASRLAAALDRAGLAAQHSHDTRNDHITVRGTDTATVGRIARTEAIELHWLASETNGLEQAFLTLTSTPTPGASAPKA